MNVFNGKKIQALEARVEDLEVDKTRQGERIVELSKPNCFKFGDSFTENNPHDPIDSGYIIEHMFRELSAIKEHLRINIREEFVDDPKYKKVHQPQMSVWKAHKVK